MSSRKSIIIFCLFFSLSGYFVYGYYFQDKYLEVIFFDIGQGDSVFVETQSKKQVLIDGGPNNSVMEKLGENMPFYDRYIDYVILTHPDADHVTGLVNVLKYFNIGQIITSNYQADSQVFKEWLEIIEQKNIPVIIANQGQEILVDEGAIIEIMWPDQEKQNMLTKANNASVVIKLTYGQTEFLLPGDIESKVEQELISSNSDLESDILKLAHHGSKTSSIQEFINKVNPQIAVISVGEDNRFGHPSEEVMQRIKDMFVYRTDIDGDVRIETNGSLIWVEVEK